MATVPWFGKVELQQGKLLIKTNSTLVRDAGSLHIFFEFFVFVDLWNFLISLNGKRLPQVVKYAGFFIPVFMFVRTFLVSLNGKRFAERDMRRCPAYHSLSERDTQKEINICLKVGRISTGSRSPAR
jgi:hypothetical protein